VPILLPAFFFSLYDVVVVGRRFQILHAGCASREPQHAKEEARRGLFLVALAADVANRGMCTIRSTWHRRRSLAREVVASLLALLMIMAMVTVFGKGTENSCDSWQTSGMCVIHMVRIGDQLAQMLYGIRF
jgi:hypothetical protein